MKIYDFVTAMADQRLPPFTRSGRLFLAQVLSVRIVNGKWVIINTPY